MNDNLQVLTGTVGVVVPEPAEGRRELLEAASAVHGVQEAKLVQGDLVVSYLAEVVSLRLVEAQLRSRGFAMHPAGRKRKGLFARFLERTAESNYKSFGGQPLDCCTLHQKKTPQRRP